MKGNQVRLEKLEGALTPKQAFLLWMEEAHQYQTVEDYARSIKGGPESAWPLVRLPNQVTKAVEQAMKGEPKEQVRPRVRQALRDVLFLFHLHQQVNRTFLERERYFCAQGLALATSLNAMVRERNLRDEMRWNSVMVALKLPYPVDSETAAVIDAAKEHYVIPWEVLEEGDEVTTWVIDYFLVQGKTALPEGAYGLLVDGLGPDDAALEEVRAAFHEPADYEKFLAREDFSYGLADVPDAEFLSHYESISSAMKGLGLDGQVVELATVPHAFLRDAPLVGGEWIDAYVVAVAEWGARLVQKGYSLEEPQDRHPFASFSVLDQERVEVPIEVRDMLWEQTKRHLAGFPGGTRGIEGRRYFSWAEYRKWRGRRAKGDLTSGSSQGLALSQWNRWTELEQRDGKTILDGTTVGSLVCHADGYRYRVVDAQAEASRRRKKLLASLEARKTGNDEDLRLRNKARQWREMAEDYLGELYSLQVSFDSVNRRYFDGQSGLFSGSAHALSQLVEHAKKLVNAYNQGLAADLELLDGAVHGGEAREPGHRHTIGLSDLPGSTQGASTDQATYLVALAKAEALDAMGETE